VRPGERGEPILEGLNLRISSETLTTDSVDFWPTEPIIILIISDREEGTLVYIKVAMHVRSWPHI
jgi:hypothetical protein